MFRGKRTILPAISLLPSLFLIHAVSAKDALLTFPEIHSQYQTEAESSGQVSNLLMQEDYSHRTVNKARWRALLHAAIPIGVGALFLNPAMGVLPQFDDLIGAAALGYGIFIGPSMGNYYLGDDRGGNRGILYRAGGAALGFVLPLLIILGGGTDGVAIFGSMIPGAALFVGGAIWQFRRLPNAAESHYERNKQVRASLIRPVIIALPTLELKNGAMGIRLALQYE